MDNNQLQKYMDIAIAAAHVGSTPYGCAVVNTQTGESFSACNKTKVNGKTAHAEMEALRLLQDHDWDSSDLMLFTTGEPCPMCMGAIIWCGVKHVVYGLSINKISKYHKQIMLNAQEVINASWQKIEIEGPIREKECIDLFKKYS